MANWTVAWAESPSSLEARHWYIPSSSRWTDVIDSWIMLSSGPEADDTYTRPLLPSKYLCPSFNQLTDGLHLI
jgi:hypothetical protein